MGIWFLDLKQQIGRIDGSFQILNIGFLREGNATASCKQEICFQDTLLVHIHQAAEAFKLTGNSSENMLCKNTDIDVICWV